MYGYIMYNTDKSFSVCQQQCNKTYDIVEIVDLGGYIYI